MLILFDILSVRNLLKRSGISWKLNLHILNAQPSTQFRKILFRDHFVNGNIVTRYFVLARAQS